MLFQREKCQTSYASSVVNLSLQTNGSRSVIDSKLFPIVVVLFGRDEFRLTSQLVVFGIMRSSLWLNKVVRREN